MNHIQEEIQDIHDRLSQKSIEFSGAFLNVKNLDFLLKKHPAFITESSIDPLLTTLKNNTFGKQRQAYFLYRVASETLIQMSVLSLNKPIIKKVIKELRALLAGSSGNKHRAIAESLGSFPLQFQYPDIKNPYRKHHVSISWGHLLEKNNIKLKSEGTWLGRSLIFETTDDTLLVLKTVKKNDDLKSIESESAWMESLNQEMVNLKIKFSIPRPINIKGRFLFKIRSLPVKLPRRILAHKDRLFISYITGHDYFIYPNESDLHKRIDEKQFHEMMTRNAYLLGLLASRGVVHTAPIPLFHNRVQSGRRSDGGLYEWPRGGRLDKWLASCRYPNFGESGLRDFEHFHGMKTNTRKYYEYLGSHIMSLVLVTGSYFRNSQPERCGYDEKGHPTDQRELFDHKVLKTLIHDIFQSYFKGYTGSDYHGPLPIDLDEFTTRLINEMGVDNHMEEILRARDQTEMSQEEFTLFLTERGLKKQLISELIRGKEDITTLTGPHLGGFNQKISLPELICFLATCVSFCISEKFYLDETGSIPS